MKNIDGMAEKSSNDVIYLETDEDITSAIDKLRKATSGNVQVVTANRSPLFQSVINQKLLKKAADGADKKLVLVTTDPVVTNLASRTGVPIASKVGEAPATASTAAVAQTDDEIDGGDVDGTVDPNAVKPEPQPAAPEAPALKHTPVSDKPKAAASAGAAKSKVPNFNRLQRRVLWIGGGVLAILLLLGLNFYFTKAKVTLLAKADQINANFSFTADPTASNSNVDDATLAATQLQTAKNLTGSIQASGNVDKGTKASGTMKIYNSYDSSAHQFVAGTRFVAPDGRVFRSTADASVPGSTVSGGKIVAGQTTVGVSADQNGDSYNEAPAHYSIPGLSADQQAGIYGEGGQMQGGTSKTVKVITQADVDRAKQSALDQDKDKTKKELATKAGKGQTMLDPSLQQNVTSVDSNPDVGAEAASGTVTVHVNYIALAVQKSQLSELTRSREEKQVGPGNQIYDDGSSNLQLTADKPKSDGAQTFHARATAFSGAKIDTKALRDQLKNKKLGEAVDLSQQQPGVEKADIVITPGWATSMPAIAGHIKIEIKASGLK